jgi:hypothetical protein
MHLIILNPRILIALSFSSSTLSMALPSGLSAYPAPPQIFFVHLIPIHLPSHLLILPLCIPSFTLFMYTVCIIHLSCPARSSSSTLSLYCRLFHLLILPLCPTASLHQPYHGLRPSYPLILPGQIFLSTLSLHIHCSPSHLLILTLCPTASLHRPFLCTLSVPSPYPAHYIPSSTLSMYTVRLIRLSCPTESQHPPNPCTPSVPSTYPAPLHPFILLIHVHYPSHPLILPFILLFIMYTIRLIRLSCPLHPFIHPIHVHCPSYSLILPH